MFWLNLNRSPPNQATLKVMVDLKMQIPATKEVEVDTETLAAIDRGIKHANESCSVPLEQVLEMIPKWISKFESQTNR